MHIHRSHHRAVQPHAPAPAPRGPIRVGDDDRERVVELLRGHAVAGRLDADELEERLERAYAARYGAELQAVLAELPSGPERSRPPARRSRPPLALLPIALAAHTRVVDRIRDGFAAAVADGDGHDDALRRAGRSFAHPDREALLCQLQGYAASGDDEVRDHVRAEFTRLFDEVRALTGASRDDVALFIAGGMFFTVAGALNVPESYWPRPPYGGS